MDFVTLSGRIHRFTEKNRAAIAQLPGPAAELVAAVVGGVSLHAGQEGVSGQCGEPVLAPFIAFKAQQPRRLGRVAEQPGSRDWCRCDGRPQGPVDGTGLVQGESFTGQFAQQAVVEGQHENEVGIVNGLSLVLRSAPEFRNRRASPKGNGAEKSAPSSKNPASAVRPAS